jgi:hypothetical protein
MRQNVLHVQVPFNLYQQILVFAMMDITWMHPLIVYHAHIHALHLALQELIVLHVHLLMYQVLLLQIHVYVHLEIMKKQPIHLQIVKHVHLHVLHVLQLQIIV